MLLRKGPNFVGRPARRPHFTQVVRERLAELPLAPDANIPADLRRARRTPVEPHPKQPDAPAVQDFCAQNLQAIEAAASRTAGRPEY
jgi:hypothetical protein